jgi:hypothetical protein
VPWCPDCDRFYNPNSLEVDGTCPTCGRALGEEHGAEGEAKPEKLRRFSDEPAPWHFKVLIVVVSIYLSFRLIQGIVWVGHHA